MPLVNVMVNGRAYTIACDDGEEDHLRGLAAHVDSKVRELLESVGQVGDQRLMLMAALLITDEFFEARGHVDAHAQEAGELKNAHAEVSERLDKSEQIAFAALEKAARRVEDIAARLAQA
jgi:cell division protein ZapA